MMLHLDRFRSLSLLGAFLLLAGLPLGCRRAEEPAEEKHPALVEVTPVTRSQRLEEWTELLGTTQPLPDRVARVSAAVEGQVKWVLGDGGKGPRVQEGQPVHEGDVIAKLDDRVVKANLARLEAAQKKLEDQKKQADVALKLAQIEVKRLRKLRASNVTVAETDLEKARLGVEDARLKRQAVETDQVAGKADLEAVKVQLSLYTLTAPLSGQLGIVQVRPGQTIAIGTTVAEVMNLSKTIDVLCYVPPATIRRLRRGQPARIVTTASATPTEPPLGQVEVSDQQSDPQTGNYPVIIRFPNHTLQLRVGTVVRVRVLTRTEKNCDTLPAEAVQEDQEPPVVVVVRNLETKKNEETGETEKIGKAFRLPVKLGIRDRANGRVQIVEILAAKDARPKDARARRAEVQGEQYVVSGGRGLQDEDEVKIEEKKEKDKD